MTFLPNFVAQSMGRALTMLASILVVVWVGRIHGPDALGMLSFVMSAVAIGVVLANVRTPSVLARELARLDDDGARRTLLGNFVLVRLATTAVATLVLLAWATFHHDVTTGNGLLVAAFGLPFAASRFYDPVFQVYRRPWYSLLASATFGLAHLLTAYALLVALRVPVIDYLWGWLVCHVGYVLLATGLAARVTWPEFAPTRQDLGHLVALAAPLAVGSVFATVHARLDVLLLGYIADARELGIYAAAAKLLELGLLATAGLLGPWLPIVSRYQAADPMHAARHCHSVIAALAVVVMPVPIIAHVVGERFLVHVFGAPFAEAAPLLPLLSAAFVLASLSLVAVTMNIALGQVRHLAWSSAAAVLVLSTLGYLWRDGGGGAVAGAVTLSHGVMLAVNGAFLFRHARTAVPIRQLVALLVTNGALTAGVWLIGNEWRDAALATGLLCYALLAHVSGLLPIRSLRQRRVSCNGLPGQDTE